MVNPFLSGKKASAFYPKGIVHLPKRHRAFAEKASSFYFIGFALLQCEPFLMPICFIFAL